MKKTDKHIGNGVTVDLSKSRMVRDWGKGDTKVELWTDGVNVWCDTNVYPVNGYTDLVALLIECGMDLRAAEAVANGDVDAAMISECPRQDSYTASWCGGGVGNGEYRVVGRPWRSADGDEWTDANGQTVRSEAFDSATITLLGGPRNGVTVR